MKPIPTARCSLPARQSGVTLLSLMIASAIGIFLLGAMFKVYLDSKQSFNVRSVVAETSETLRFALDDMRRILVMAGRGIRAGEDMDDARRAFPPYNDNPTEAADAGAAYLFDGSVDIGSPEEALPDIIAVRYRIGPGCGSYIDTSVDFPPAMIRFRLRDSDGDGMADSLLCEQTTYEDGTPSTSTRTLAAGVYMLKVLYGVDGDADGYANLYLTATEVEEANVWRNVVSLRVALVVGSETVLPPGARPQAAPTLQVLGLPFQAPDAARHYRVGSATIALRNLNPTVQRQ